jgi:mRNA interferase HicA
MAGSCSCARIIANFCGPSGVEVHKFHETRLLGDIAQVPRLRIAPRLLASKGCTFETHKGGSGHLTVRRGDRKSQLPMHGSRKELGKGLVNKILKDLGLK